ncbi:MAG TPA: TIGR00730 family Rossman fold protein [Baekduia sp.]|nr:TIGR00730 family Rossman fold protein [Baekduia sp.]
MSPSAEPEQVRPHAPATIDEELLGTKRRAVLPTQTEQERIARIDRDLEAGFAALRELGPAVTFFGSARVAPDHPYYARSREAARRVGGEGFAIITGGGPGLMEAANRGARDAGVTSVGLNIELPFEQAPNPYQDIALTCSYFFTRKMMFVRYATAFVVLPGGFGTLDELFEALVLEQVDKIRDFPIILVGVAYWGGLVAWIRERLLAEGMIAEGDARLLMVTDDVDEVARAVCRARAVQEV